MALVTIAFGGIGYLMNKYGFSPAATVLGLLLGYIVEISMRRALVISNVGWWIFVERPIAFAFILLSVLTLFYPIILKWWARRNATRPAAAA